MRSMLRSVTVCFPGICAGLLRRRMSLHRAEFRRRIVIEALAIAKNPAIVMRRVNAKLPERSNDRRIVLAWSLNCMVRRHPNLNFVTV